jgi:amino acid adenylation domain-containing protein
MIRLVQEYCRQNADRRPDAAVVRLGEWRFTYGELESISNRIASALRDAGCRRGDRVGLLLAKSPLAIASILGVLKADCIYVPMDPESPGERACHIVESAEPRVILAEQSTSELLQRILGTLQNCMPGTGWLDARPAPGIDPVFCYADVLSAPDQVIDASNRNSDAAYIMYTSGSTGIPKGVVISHNNITHFIEWAVTYFSIGPRDRLSGHTPLHFDLSVLDIFTTLAAGAELHLVPLELNVQARGLAEFIRMNMLTQWFSVPSVLNYMAKFNTVAENDFPALRRVMWCGEVFPISGLRYWMARLPHVSFTNLYGPTETTVASTHYSVPAPPNGDAPLPIGQACGGEQVFVLNEEMKPVQPGETGELYIGGAGLSTGYWKNPDKTAAAFVRNPFDDHPASRLYRTGDLAKTGDDGMVYFLGRRDSQVKCRGYRIELGEIEAALGSVDMLKESAVVAATTEGFEGVVICCAYSPVPGVTVTPIQLRELLKTKVPAYMLPSRWIQMEQLPKNANGKTDKPAVKELFCKHETVSGAEAR